MTVPTHILPPALVHDSGSLLRTGILSLPVARDPAVLKGVGKRPRHRQGEELPHNPEPVSQRSSLKDTGRDIFETLVESLQGVKVAFPPPPHCR